MKTGKYAFYAGLAFVMAMSGLLSGCATGPSQGAAPTEYAGVGKGSLYEMGEVKAGTFDTAPYIPQKIKFEVVKGLKEKGLLAGPQGSERRLVVHIVVFASYLGYHHTFTGCQDCYNELASHVQVSDPQKGEVIARTVVHSFNGGGAIVNVSDFTEMDHAKQIVTFLESLVR